MILQNFEFIGYRKYSEFQATLWLKKGDWKIEIDSIPTDIIELKGELEGNLIDISFEIRNMPKPSDDRKDDMRREAEDMRKEQMKGLKEE